MPETGGIPFRGNRNGLTNAPQIIFAVVLTGAIVLWSLPVIGLVVNSFRPYTNATSEGWWTVFTNPVFTLDNYRTALS